ncbi:manganese efflux pump MntP [Gabonibacter chumensis]|uniref:manganese efflux pump MntP n=1 Tax=Gabonibacter chumensis TaxID=2972474 RepID=UPI0025736FEF|nr:manganese efflux pump MntP family protein [Gabonibacter chumensis]MCR9011510.1 manganese efflux pump MntP family protein [Gabonibacter chumensis]
MGIITMFMIAVGLAMDSLAVSISGGIFMKPFWLKQAMKLALTMGVFQGGMTLAGWALGVSFSSYITAYDHWIAFILLSFLGGKMIYESFQKEKSSFASLSNKTLLTLGVATSIDALAVGISMAFLKVSIYLPSFIIGFTTFVLSLAGVCFGYRFGKIKGINVELLGGIILIAIGTKILIEHCSE